MNQKIINTLMFTAGALIGSLVTYKLVAAKYERLIQEEIDSVKATWSKMGRQNNKTESTIEVDDDDDDDDWDDETVGEYRQLANVYNCEEGGGDDEVPYINGPYVISPDEFANCGFEYSLYALTYYSDNVLANDWDEIQDIEETIGEDALEHFGDYTEDVVHVRNKRNLADYEVTRDPRRYVDVLAANAPSRGYAD